MIKNSILQVAYNIINWHVLNNKYNQLLSFLFESELYSTLQVIYMINIVFLLQQIDVLTCFWMNLGNEKMARFQHVLKAGITKSLNLGLV